METVVSLKENCFGAFPYIFENVRLQQTRFSWASARSVCARIELDFLNQYRLAGRMTTHNILFFASSYRRVLLLLTKETNMEISFVSTEGNIFNGYAIFIWVQAHTHTINLILMLVMSYQHLRI